MPDTLESAILSTTEQTIQSQVRDTTGYGSTVFLSTWLAAGSGLVPPWWSRSRDIALRQFWKTTDYLSGAVYTMQAKMTAIPFRVEPKDWSIQEHVKQAETMTESLVSYSQFGAGWVELYGKFVEDLIATDNGAFMEVLGDGDPAGPIKGQATGLAHLDSTRCVRSGNALYPVIYEDVSGKVYKLHFSRVIFASLMPSPDINMYSVGFCSVSRVLNIAQTLYDILTFKQEKMGSRPHRKIIITKGGLDPKDLHTAFAVSESAADNRNLSRYSLITLVGHSSLPEADAREIDLASLPDGFDEKTSIELGMATIALGFGMDARELFPAISSGASRADALLQHMKQRGKAPGQILQMTEQLLRVKFLPRHLKLVFDYQDDAQDRQVADVRKVRSDRRKVDMDTGTLNVRTMREQMLADGDIDRGQFERLELQDGRTANGASVLALFYSQDAQIKMLLDLGVADPLDIQANSQLAKPRLQDAPPPLQDKAFGQPPNGQPPNGGPPPTVPLNLSIFDKIEGQLAVCNKTHMLANTEQTRMNCLRATAALVALYKAYKSGKLPQLQDDGTAPMPGRVPVNREQRRLDTTSPNNNTDQGQVPDGELEADKDDGAE